MQFIGVAWTGNDDSFQGFIDKHALTFPNLSDDPGDIYARFGVPSQPALVIVDATGDVQLLFGAVESDVLDNILSSLTV